MVVQGEGCEVEREVAEWIVLSLKTRKILVVSVWLGWGWLW